MSKTCIIFGLILILTITAGVRSQDLGRTFLSSEGRPETYPAYFEFSISGNDYRIPIEGNGSVTTSDGKRHFFNLRLSGELLTGSRLYYADYNGDLLLISDVGNIEYASGFIARLDLNTMRLKWKTSLPGFNVGTGIIDQRNVYVTAIGFIGKINLETGKYLWKHSNLYGQKTGAFNSFDVPEVRGKMVVFKEIQTYSWKKVAQINVDRATGRIVTIDR